MSRRSKTQKNRDKKRKNDLIGIAIISLVVIIAIIVFIVQSSIVSGTKSIDEVTNCPDKIKEDIVFIIDLTDTLNRTQDIIVRESIKSKVFNSNNQTRFNFYLLTENIDDFQVYLTICNPGDGSDANEFISNKRRLAQRWEEGFKNHIDDIMNLLSTTPEAKYSPVVESIKIASVERFFNSDAERKKLILISDLLQHSSGFTNYKNNYSSESAVTNSYLIQNRPYLRNVEVEVLYIYRPNASTLQTNKHALFWQNIIGESDGYLKEMQVVR